LTLNFAKNLLILFRLA